MKSPQALLGTLKQRLSLKITKHRPHYNPIDQMPPRLN